MKFDIWEISSIHFPQKNNNTLMKGKIDIEKINIDKWKSQIHAKIHVNNALRPQM